MKHGYSTVLNRPVTEVTGEDDNCQVWGADS